MKRSEPNMSRDDPRGAALILNPNSGTSRPSGELVDLFTARGIPVRVFESEDPHESAAAARAEGFETLIAAGGDGTVRAVSSVVVQSGGTLGVLPAGTRNHFAAALGLPFEPERAIDTIRGGKTTMVDIAEVNGDFFINNSSLGFYPVMVVLRRTEEKRGFSRWTATLRAGLMTWLRLPTLDVRLTSREARIERTTPLVFVGNNEYTMDGANVGTRQSLREGVLFVSIAHATSRFDVVRMAVRALAGRLTDTDGFDAFSTTEAVVESRRSLVRVSLDGEVRLMRSPLHYCIHPAALRVLVP
jgi:diacylglycerol kinase family enzyme